MNEAFTKRFTSAVYMNELSVALEVERESEYFTHTLAPSPYNITVVAMTEAWLLERLCRDHGDGRAPERAARQLGRWARCRWPSRGPRSHEDVGLHCG